MSVDHCMGWLAGLLFPFLFPLRSLAALMWPLHSFLGPQSRIILVLLLLPASFVEGAIINTTIDDTETSFKWSESWTAVTPSEPCAGCASKPDASQVEGGSWHDGNIMTTKDDSAGGSFTFQGQPD